MPDTSTLLFLGFMAFFAGGMDAMVGGGGLIMLPSLLIGLPSTATATVLGTSKLLSVSGTSAAAVKYVRNHRPQYRYAVPMAIAGLVSAGLGATAATQISTAQLKPAILVALIGVWLFTWKRKEFGSEVEQSISHRRALTIALVGGTTIGFYDGMIGPGTGVFLLFLLINGEHTSFLRASSTAKIVNTATNIGALIVFSIAGHVLFELGLILGACNIAGSFLGSHLAIEKGSKFVRAVFLVVVSLLILRLSYDVL